jgi:NADH:ubiquinone oxidoreductase subunit 6 (subunit J)
VGFYPHVDRALREAALAAGVDQVLPRSAFTVRLAALLAGALGVAAIGTGTPVIQPGAGAAPSYLVQPFSVEFLREYWLHFELTSVLLVAAVVAAIAIIRSGRRSDG